MSFTETQRRQGSSEVSFWPEGREHELPFSVHRRMKSPEPSQKRIK
jgi:hypothetical protein